jgi:DNA-binding NarL/FixJ family response regulator
MKENNKKLSVLIAEQLPLVAESIHAKLSMMQRISKITIVQSDDLLITDLKNAIPDVIILGISKGTEEDKLELINLIRARCRLIYIIIVVEAKDANFVTKIFLSGVNAVISRNECSSYEIQEVIEYVRFSKHYLSDVIKDKIIEEILYPPISDDSITNNFIDKDLQLIRLLSQGKTSQEIADHLDITQHIVTAKKRKLCKKLNAKNAPHLVQKAFSTGLLSINYFTKHLK